MSNSKIDKNSISPNGIQKDADGYTIFYPIGTNKVVIPSNSPYWPKGSKLVGTFVYDKNDKLVGFCDTKAMISENSEEIVVMPYEYIDTEFDSIEKDSIQIHAPKAVVKKASWTGSNGKIDIPDVDYKYKGCKNLHEIKTVDANFLENDIVDGKWTELLSDLQTGHNMFLENQNITSFTSDLSSLINGHAIFMACHNLFKFDADLSSLISCTSMFHNCSNLTSFKSDLSSLNECHAMFHTCSKLRDFKCNNLSHLTIGESMFLNCPNLETFTYDMSSLINGTWMFRACSNLITFKSDLSSLENGNNMFYGCQNLSQFECKSLKSLTNGRLMFQGCSNLKSFHYDLKSLIDGYQMFYNCKFSSFISDLKSLTDGTDMFGYCDNLTNFISNLSSLTIGNSMFTYCKLDASSIKNIIDTINTVETGEILIGMGCDNNTTDKDFFAQEVGYVDMTSLLETLQSKGWTVTAQYNGRPSSTFSLRKPESLPVFVKLIEVIPTEEDSYYEYTSQDGSKFYNLDWFHETTGSTDGYTQFNSLEESVAQLLTLN